MWKHHVLDKWSHMLFKLYFPNDIALRVLPNGKTDFDFAVSLNFIRQKIKENLLTWLNECFNNISIGMPYRERILVNSPNLLEIRSIFYKAIIQTPGVNRIENLELNLDKKTRNLEVQFTVITDSDEVLEVDSRNNKDFIIQI